MNSEEIQFNPDDRFDDMDNQKIYENYTVMFALPLSNHDNMPLMAIAAFYALLFLLGTCGNAAILAVVHHVKGAADHRSRHNSTLTYIIILCTADFISMLPLPMTIIDQILGFWMFGTFACKLFRLLEHIGKIFSTFVLVAFSIDRYMAVVHPLKARRNNNQLIVFVLGGTLAFTCVMLSPILLYAHSKELIINEKYDMAQRTITKMHLFKCVDDLGDSLFIWFTIYCFFLAYMMPLMAMIFFYYRMLSKLYKQARAVRQALSGGRRKGMDEKIPVGHIAVYTGAICLFHFVCWTPYWVSVMYSLYIEIFDPTALLSTPTFKFIYIMYGVHALPYINSACNFILYGMLNRQLHQTPERKYGQVNGRNHCVATPALRLTECSEMVNHHSTVPDSTIVRTPPSDVSMRMTEHSPLVVKREMSSNSPKSSSLNGLILSSSHEQITECSANDMDMDEESIII